MKKLEPLENTSHEAYWLPPDLAAAYRIDNTLLKALPVYEKTGNMAQALMSTGLTEPSAYRRAPRDKENITGLLIEIGDPAKFATWVRPWLNLRRFQDLKPGQDLSNTARERLAEGIRADARVPDAPRQVQNTILVLDSGKLWSKVRQALASELASNPPSLPQPDNLDGSIEAEIIEDAPLDAVHNVGVDKDE
jgi:hypothetical protein